MEIPTTGKDCRVSIPVEANKFMQEQNAVLRVSDKRLIPITLVVEALIEVGLRAGGWQEIVIKKTNTFKPLGPRARQPKKKTS